MKKYCIYYITTGSYTNYAENFFNSLVHFMPGCKKTVVWLSDNFKVYRFPKDITVKQIGILDMPWPLVTLLKMHYIINNRIDGYDGYFYFNANAEIFDEENNKPFNIINDALENGKFIGTKHLFCIEDKTIKYVQACFFGGNEDKFFKVCEDVVKLVDEKLRNNIILDWHDETALNIVLKDEVDEMCLEQFGLSFEKLYALNEFDTVFFKVIHNMFKKDKTKKNAVFI